MDEVSFLIEWMEKYLVSRDAFTKKIQSIERKENTLKVNRKDEEEIVIIMPDLDYVKPDGKTTIVSLNNRANIDHLVDNWTRFAQLGNLKIYFINPFSTTDKKWVINPHIHSKICDESTLRQGLLAMFETVEPLTREILRSRLKV